MTAYLNLLKTVQKLAEKSAKFGDMTPAQQAGHRAAVTRAKATAKELAAGDLLAALNKITDIIGEAAEKTARERMTADGLVEEYNTSYIQMSARERGAFKAKVSRLLNLATDEGDDHTVSALNALTTMMEQHEVEARRRALNSVLKGLTAAGDES